MEFEKDGMVALSKRAKDRMLAMGVAEQEIVSQINLLCKD